MLKSKAVGSPTLDTNGAFAIRMGDFARISRDVVSQPITGTASSGGTTIPMTDTSGFAAGQNIVIQDLNGAETAIVDAVTAGTSLTTSANLVNSYTVANGGRVVVVDLARKITGTASSGGTTIPITNTTGFYAGQTLVIEDKDNAEVATVSSVTAGTSITTSANLVNSYTVANGAQISVVNGNPARCSVKMQKPFAASAGSAEFIDCNWDAGVNYIVVTVEKAVAAAGPALPYTWGAAATADVAGFQFVAEADGE